MGLIKYIITLLIWFLILFIIESNKNSNGISIDTLISIIALASPILSNLQIKEINSALDWLVSKISLQKFFVLTTHIFFTIFLLTAIIMPIAINEFPDYLIKLGNLDEWKLLFKLIIIYSFSYTISFYGISLIGKSIDNDTKDNIKRKYALVYVILLVIYITAKLLSNR